MTHKGDEQVEADHWTLSQEREFIENILCQRFNFLLVFYSLVLAGAFTTELQLNFNLLLTLGALITSLLSITIARVQLRLDCILEVIENQEPHPTKKTNDLIKISMKSTNRPLLWFLVCGSRRKWIGYLIPLLCSASLVFGAGCGWMEWLTPVK